jgi:plasmid maintenance system antidote protein VapI
MSTVTPNAAAFKKIYDNLLLVQKLPPKAIAAHMGVSISTLNSLIAGKTNIRLNTIKKVSKNLGISSKNLIVTTNVAKLPHDPSFYENLEFGYFIDHGRTSENEKTQWHPEIIKLQRVDGSDANWVWFTGSIKNDKHGSFVVQACLVRHQSFAILAAHRDRGDAFVATFSHVACVGKGSRKQVLCGIWSGEDNFSRLAVYRMLCSKKGESLNSEEISQILQHNRIITKFEDDEMANQPQNRKQRVLIKESKIETS